MLMDFIMCWYKSRSKPRSYKIPTKLKYWDEMYMIKEIEKLIKNQKIDMP